MRTRRRPGGHGVGAGGIHVRFGLDHATGVRCRRRPLTWVAPQGSAAMWILARVRGVSRGVDVAMLVGAMPRRPGMERKDLLLKNAEIFRAQGKALDQFASKNVKVP